MGFFRLHWLATPAALALGFAAGLATAQDGGDLLVVAPVELDAHPQAQMLPNAKGCAVDISSSNKPLSRVITIGEGATEMMSCGKFVSAGALAALPGSVGLIYDVEAGAGPGFRAAVIVSPTDEGWIVNEAFEGVITSSSDVDSLEKLNSALAAQN